MEGDQPATDPSGGQRGPRHLAAPQRTGKPARTARPARAARSRRRDEQLLPPDPILPLDDTTALRRVRSGVVLAVLLTILGLLAAIAVGVLAVAFVTTLKQAVG
jgi:hypothetical protein